MLIQKITSSIEHIWKKTERSEQLTFGENIFLSVLKILAPVYRALFFLSQRARRARKPYKSDHFKVISIGNISVGGTGKSVVAQYVIHAFSKKKGAILLRGYNRKEHQKKSVLVSDGATIFHDIEQTGDEAMMHAQMLKCPIAVGKNRAQSVQLLQEYWDGDYVLLDDAYQHHAVKKDFEILILDARMSIESTACLPAGPLREKDITRADLILVSHAQHLSATQRVQYTQKLSFGGPVLFGRHALSGFCQNGKNMVHADTFRTAQCGAFAGIGSFQSFLSTLKQQGVALQMTQQFPDHHNYTQADIDEVIKSGDNNNIDVLFTTRKDWVKVAPFFEKTDLKVIVVDITFSFLTPKEEEQFVSEIRNKLGWND